MVTDEQTVGAKVWWVLRARPRRAAALMALVTALALVVTAQGFGDDSDRYEASALVVARSLEIKPENLPRFALAVFEAGDVAESVGRSLPTGVTTRPDDLVPDRIRLEPVADTVALRVVGSAAERSQAISLANSAANAFVDELNEVGPGVGVFGLQAPARSTTTTLAQEQGSMLGLTILISLLAGAAVTLAAMVVYLARRRPVTTAEETAALTGTDVSTVVVRGPRPEAVQGLVAFLRKSLLDATEEAALVGCGPRRQTLEAFASAVADVIGASGPIRRIDLHADSPRVPNDHRRGVIAVSAIEVDVPQLLPASAAIVLVVPEGVPAAAVESAVAQFVRDEIRGAVFVRMHNRKAIDALAEEWRLRAGANASPAIVSGDTSRSTTAGSASPTPPAEVVAERSAQQ